MIYGFLRILIRNDGAWLNQSNEIKVEAEVSGTRHVNIYMEHSSNAREHNHNVVKARSHKDRYLAFPNIFHT